MPGAPIIQTWSPKEWAWGSFHLYGIVKHLTFLVFCDDVDDPSPWIHRSALCGDQ